MKPSIKRLAKDHLILRRSLPPNYLFPPDSSPSDSSDLTSLTIFLAGPLHTPYTSGLFTLLLAIPPNYPSSPPTATFRTRIFHPNVDETTGAVCLETLKRDWDPNLTLKDILITISCLLIQPNPDSALNEAAGKLVREDYGAFADRARLMTRIHAGIPEELREAADEARRRGEVASDEVGGNAKDQEKMLKENQPSLMPVREDTGDEKASKRSIEQVSGGTDLSCGEREGHARRRKSPKHYHIPGDNALVEAVSAVGSCTIQHKEPLIDPGPEKVIFRAQWKLAAIGLRTKARVGIRRL